MKKVKAFAKLMRDKGMKIKETVLLYPKNMRSTYFRGEGLFDTVSDNKAKVEKIFKDFELDLSTEQNVEKFLGLLVMAKFLVRFERKPDEKKKFKWPKEVVLARQQIFGKKMFFNWTFKDKKSSFWAILIVSVIIMMLLFPIWPIKMKIFTFYLSLYLLIFLMGFIVLRLALYLIVRVFGFEFWILPEIFESDSFVPVISFERADDALWGWIFRLSLAIFFIYISHTIYTDDLSISDVKSASTSSFNDIASWGRMQLGIDGKKGNMRFNSFAEEMLLGDAEDSDPDEEEDEDGGNSTKEDEGGEKEEGKSSPSDEPNKPQEEKIKSNDL